MEFHQYDAEAERNVNQRRREALLMFDQQLHNYDESNLPPEVRGRFKEVSDELKKMLRNYDEISLKFPIGNDDYRIFDALAKVWEDIGLMAIKNDQLHTMTFIID